MSDLRPQARRVLADYAAIVGPDEPTAMQNWSGLVRRIERDEPEIDLGAAVPTRGRTRAHLVVAGVVAFAAAAAVLWLGGRATVAALAIEDSPSAASWQSGVTTDPGESANVVDRVIVVDDDAQPRPRVRPEIPATSVPAVAPVVAPPPAPVVPRVVPRKAKPGIAPPPVPTPEVDPAAALEEVRGIARARAALRDGDPDRALRQLDGHARRWPGSDFAEEREVLRIAALCQAGRTAEAERATAAFRRAHPGSPLGAHLRHCDGGESDR